MIRLKLLFCTICAVCGMCLAAVAQQPSQASDRFDRIDNQKVAYITKQLNLTQSEAQRFFPLYNQYVKEVRNIKAAKSDVTSGKLQRDVIEFDAKEVEIKKRYRVKFAEVIGNARSSQFFVVEQEFKDMLYKEWQSRQNR